MRYGYRVLRELMPAVPVFTHGEATSAETEETVTARVILPGLMTSHDGRIIAGFAGGDTGHLSERAREVTVVFSRPFGETIC